MLTPGTDEPSAVLRFHEHTAASADLLVVGAIEIVFGALEPGVFDVCRARFGKIEDEECHWAQV